jgi:amidase
MTPLRTPPLHTPPLHTPPLHTPPLHFADAIEIARRIRSGESSAVAALDHFRGRVERFNPALNAIVVFDWERAYERARDADRALARGEAWGPLHGVPMTIKESFDVTGLATTWGDPILEQNLARQDDRLVERMRAMGAVLFGKTNVPLRLADFQSYNDIYGTTNNPWRSDRGPGGSSGGAAAALAAGLTGIEVGSDIGGSIRNPAHYCGVFGHKPTFDLVSSESLAPPRVLVNPDLAVAGPLARSARDLALTMEYLAGGSRIDARAWRVELPKPTKSLRDYRVAIWASDAEAPVDAQISARCRALGLELAKLGATVSEEARPGFTSAHHATLYRTLLNAALDPTNPLTHAEWTRLDNDRARLRLAWQKFFADWDLVIAPIAATTAFVHDHSDIRGRKLLINGEELPYFQQLFWPGLATLCYLPSTVFPTGRGSDGLPIGLQAIGNAYDDLITIDFARQMTEQRGGFEPPPGYDN